ncbi:MAG: SDR family NAD(P)-dependent oxidoreductase [bacterium]|nr:SDR family NAD(P)-dependent oxidoreductase [bacterium]
MNSLKHKKILVTGAGGFIGSHLVETLVDYGSDVRAFVKYNGRGDLGLLQDLPAQTRGALDIISGDIRDPFFVKEAVKGCDIVFHLAALIGIPYSYIAPSDYVSVNIQGTVNVLQACRELDVQRVVHTSTSEAYGTAQYVPIDEKHPLQGQSPYSASKIGADKIAESYHQSFELPVTIVRPFNTFGPRQSARAFIPTVISQALCRDKVRMGSLDPVRDMTFVKDTAEGFIQVGLGDNSIGKTINLGVGEGETIGNIARMILDIMNMSDKPVEQDAARLRPANSEVMRLISDNTLAKECCGWQPKYSLREGLTRTIEWIRSNHEMFRPDEYMV